MSDGERRYRVTWRLDYEPDDLHTFEVDAIEIAEAVRLAYMRFASSHIAPAVEVVRVTLMDDALEPPANVLTGEGAHQAGIVSTVRDDLEAYARGGRLRPVETLHMIALHVGYYLHRRGAA